MRLDSLRQAILVLLLITCLILTGSRPQLARASPEGSYDEAIRASRSAVQEMMQKGAVPGVGVAVAVDGNVVWAKGFGVADIEQRVPA
ncbi:MAG TPA: serine hydrolase [Pyrinomonadaceae bacterium]|nr:serine hydrolase [Pyrinomonadaceae bacterium]